MTRRQDSFFSALSQLRFNAQSGNYAPGRPVVIFEEARRLGVSTTPVREALSWLCGEGLIDRGPAGGFLAVRMDAGAIRDRYEFRLICLLAALDLTTGLPNLGRFPERGGDPVLDVAAFFDGLVQRAGNAMLLEAHERVGGQLLQLRAAEARVFLDIRAEAEALLALAGAEANGALRERLRRYHARRADTAAILAVDLSRHRSEISPRDAGA